MSNGIRILIIPLTTRFTWDYLDELRGDIADSLRKAGVRSEVFVAPEPVKPSMGCFDWERAQYISTCILEQLRSYADRVGFDEMVLGIGYIDAYSPGFNFVFGEAWPGRGVAAVYTKRLHPRFYGEKPGFDKYYSRLVKEAVHELGHLLGLGHCIDKKCVMSFSVDVRGVDEKTRFFCKRCSAMLGKLYI